MNYEKIILEMLERIKDLEEKVGMLEDFKVELEEKEDDVVTEITSGSEKKESGRKLSRIEIMKILREKYGFEVRQGNRSEGSGIVISKNGKSLNIKVSFSRSYFEYAKEECIICGWHTLFEKEVNNPELPFFIFVVADAENKFHYFIFTREEIIKEFSYKKYDANKKLHFYFTIKKDGRPVDLREGEEDMSSHYNNWDKFKAI